MRIINRLIDGLLPAQCLVCQKPSDINGRCLCSDCAHFLPETHHRCSSCGLSLDNPLAAICGQCLKRPPTYSASWSAWWYEAPVSQMLRDLKYHRQLATAELLGNLMTEKIRREGVAIPDALLPVPLHYRRLLRRGFNQATELFRPVARQLNIPIIVRGVRRNRSTPSQVGMDLRERRRNLRGAFSVHARLPAHVAIVDDVITTGTTVSELSRALKRSGVKQVQVWSAARADAP